MAFGRYSRTWSLASFVFTQCHLTDVLNRGRILDDKGRRDLRQKLLEVIGRYSEQNDREFMMKISPEADITIAPQCRHRRDSSNSLHKCCHFSPVANHFCFKTFKRILGLSSSSFSRQYKLFASSVSLRWYTISLRPSFSSSQHTLYSSTLSQLSTPRLANVETYYRACVCCVSINTYAIKYRFFLLILLYPAYSDGNI